MILGACPSRPRRAGGPPRRPQAAERLRRNPATGLGAFDVEWFLDGRRRDPPEGWGYGLDSQRPVRPMALNPQPLPAAPILHYHGSNQGEAAAVMNAVAPMAFAAPNPDAQQVSAVCRAVWNESGPQGPRKFACNCFAIEVAHRPGIVLSRRADQIVDTLRVAPWTLLQDGTAARDAAAQGKLVLVALKSGDFSPPQIQGHVAVVVTGPMNPGGWAPAAYWGSTDPSIRDLGGSGMPVSRCFPVQLDPGIAATQARDRLSHTIQ